MSRSRRLPAVLASLSVAGAALAILGAVLQVGADVAELEVAEAAAQPTATPEPAPEPEPEPEPVREPVTAVVDAVEVEDLSVSGSQLYRAGSGGDAAVAIDETAVTAFRDAIVAVVDAHLLDQQTGGDGTIEAAGLVGSTEALRFLGPEQTLDEVRYRVRIGVRGTPEWGRVAVDLDRTDGSAVTAELVFVPGDTPTLLAAFK